MKRIVTFTRSAALVAALVGLAAGAAGAQQPAGSWQGWLGCWTAGPAIGGMAPSALAPLVCITPTADANVVDLVTVSDDKIVSTQRIDASGRELPVETKGCTGTQRAQWSADGRRVYLKATATCDGLARTTSGIIAMSPTGEWLDVQGVSAGSDEGVRVARYRDAGVPSAVPEQVAAALRSRATASQGARLLAGATIGSSAVIEASRAVAPAVVQAWLLERGQAFALDAAELVRLADAGVPGPVTDAMVAVSNPQVFAVARPEAPSRDPRRADDDVVGRRIYVYMDPLYSPYGWGYAPYGYGYGYGRYGYSTLGYGNYGYGPGLYGYPGYLPPVVIVNPGQAQARGHAVKGRGYTQTDPTSTTATPATARAAERAAERAAAASTQSSSPPPRSEPAAAPAPRTAHPKP
ncbi:MAG: hypothetical protein HOQ31_15365 [Gemmatimonadaceae bacterium]|nr:hypothetical protein [Gemmatimonadaceae bacterium]